MKQIRIFAGMTFVLLLAVAAFASDKSSVNLTLNHPSMVNGTALKPGEYKLVLDRNGDAVQATFLSGKKTVATTTGHFEPRQAFGGDVSLVVDDKDHSIQQIVVHKMKGAVVLDGATATAGGH